MLVEPTSPSNEARERRHVRSSSFSSDGGVGSGSAAAGSGSSTAAAPGSVEKLFWSDLGGNTIYIRSPDGRRMFYYAHLDAYRDNLREGDKVRTGEPIATVGATGNADPSGPHLHFAVLNTQPSDNWSEGDPVNPYPLLAR